MTDGRVLYGMMIAKSSNWTWTFRRVKALEHAVKALQEEKPECVLKQDKNSSYRICSVCDGTIECVLAKKARIVKAIEIKYCPYCGAKVMDIEGEW